MLSHRSSLQQLKYVAFPDERLDFFNPLSAETTTKTYFLKLYDILYPSRLIFIHLKNSEKVNHPLKIKNVIKLRWFLKAKTYSMVVSLLPKQADANCFIASNRSYRLAQFFYFIVHRP